MRHSAFGNHAEEVAEILCREMNRLERLFSRFSDESDVIHINRTAGIGTERVSPETGDLLQKVLELCRCSSGCLDVTVGPLVDLWGACKKSLTPPDERSIHRKLSLVDYRDLGLNLPDNKAGLKRKCQAIDLGSIGKGYAGDRIREILDEWGISSAYSNLGGHVVAVGAKPDGSPWQVGIQHPRKTNRILGSVAVINKTVAASGGYQRYMIDRDGKRYHHILDPKTGYPAESGLISVTVVSEDSLTADALSTTLFIAGLETGLRVLKKFPGAEAVFAGTDMRVYITEGLKNRFQAEEKIDLTILD